MRWYTAVLKRIVKGVVLFLLPMFLLFFVMSKAIALVRNLLLPLKQYLPTERVLGVGLLSIISLVLILVICYTASWLAERKRIKAFVASIENNLLVFIPGYSLLKTRASETIIGETNDKWKAVITDEGDEELKFGIEVDRQGGYCTVFFPEPPDAKQGEMKLLPESKVKRLDISVNKMMNIARQYGRDAAALAKE